MIKVPLAWANLTHDRVRFALFILGIVFAVVLMFVQLGFRGALLDSQTLFHQQVNADLVLVAPTRQALAMPETFNRRRLKQAMSVPGVAEVHAIFVDNGLGKLRHIADDVAERKPSRGIRVIGIDPDSESLKFDELKQGQPATRLLKYPGYALFDRATAGFPHATEFGPYRDGVSTELNGQRITFVGTIQFGPDFTSDGGIVVSTETFADFLRRPFTFGPPLAEVDLAAIRLQPGVNVKDVQHQLQKVLGQGAEQPDVDVLTPREWIAREHNFWLNNTPIGFAFGFGMFMGFAVGLVICYQILSGDVADHLAEYATLKAVGYSNFYLARVVIEESLILAVAGFAVGLLVSYGAYQALSASTGLPMNLTIERCVWLLVATVLMCICSGLIALRRLIHTDPADVF